MKYYFLGIKGAGMSSLAQILYDLGHDIVGYDDDIKQKFTEKYLLERNIKIYYDQSFPLESDRIVVYSTAFKDTHKEIIRAKKEKTKIVKYNEMLGELTKTFSTIAVCGCHGKTTTTALLSHVFDNIIGANYLIGDGTGYANKDNKYLMIEACEYHRHFLNYYPKTTIITNIELDHIDYFKDLNDVKNAYIEFANQTDKQIIACGDDENIKSIRDSINKKVYYYGLNEDNDFKATNIVSSTDGYTFDVYFKNKLIGDFKINLYGKHMLLNTLATIAAAYLEGLDMDAVTHHLTTYRGAKRRFSEAIIKDIVIIDDYAHHPTEMKAVIESARQKYPNKDIIGVFQPHTFSRTKALYKEIAEILNTVDKSYILDIYPSRENASDWPGITHDLIVNLLNNGEHISIDMISKFLHHKNCVIIFMSPNDLHEMIEKLVILLNK
ncbi:MAG: UDP-N-acetylmuramate--L-alanine ligase [Bacilli bacterium]|nr:UDP-N-acetylmuramate--L-alanine ligase [Bacilli bacterium]